jgi:hypothetical protein
LTWSIAGKEIGVVSRKSEITRSIWYDLTAGDAVVPDGLPWEANCSPGILAYHARNSKRKIRVLLYEIQPSTYDRLVDSLNQHLPTLGYIGLEEHRWYYPSDQSVEVWAFCGSGAQAETGWLYGGDAVLTLNDPNAITDWAMRSSYSADVAEKTPWHRSVSTMGCNPHGLKRLNFDIRQGWFEKLSQQEVACPRYRDLLLVKIQRDRGAQFAYLLSEPERWKAVAEQTARNAFRRYDLTVTTAWRKSQPLEYDELKRELFLTETERREP